MKKISRYIIAILCLTVLMSCFCEEEAVAKSKNAVKVKVGKKATNKKYVKKYKKIFTRKIVGKKVKVTL